MKTTRPIMALDRLGRLPTTDIRDREYPAHRLAVQRLGHLTDDDQDVLNRGWRYWWDEGWWGDQGNEPECVAYAMLHLLEDGPHTKDPTRPGAGPIINPNRLYRGAQQNDEWPGEQYDGTSARGACKWLKHQGVISSYSWYFTLEQLVDGLLLVGPSAFGTLWTSGMFYPDEDGFIRPTGSARGGHEVLANGVNMHEEKIRFKNSWGRHWGDGGQFWMRFDDVRFLLERAGGDAVTVTEV